jgi:hypothetical protein
MSVWVGTFPAKICALHRKLVPDTERRHLIFFIGVWSQMQAPPFLLHFTCRQVAPRPDMAQRSPTCNLTIHCEAIYLSMALQPFVGPWTGDQPFARPLPTHRTTQTQNKRTQTSISRVGFEPTIPVFQRAKTVHASDRADTVIGILRD